MSVNRFQQPLTVEPQQSYISQFVPLPFEQMQRSADSEQQRLDTIKAGTDGFLAATQVDALAVDKPAARIKEDSYYNAVQEQVDKYDGDYRQMEGFVKGQIKEFSDWKRYGEGYVISTSLANYTAAQKAIDESDMDTQDKEDWLNLAYGSYAARNGAKSGKALSVTQQYNQVDVEKDLMARFKAIDDEGQLNVNGQRYAAYDWGGGGDIHDFVEHTTKNTGKDFNTQIAPVIRGYLETNPDLQKKWSLQYDVRSKLGDVDVYRRDMNGAYAKDKNGDPIMMSSAEFIKTKENELVDSFKGYETRNKEELSKRHITSDSASSKKNTSDAANATSITFNAHYASPTKYNDVETVKDVLSVQHPTTAIRAWVYDNKFNAAHTTIDPKTYQDAYTIAINDGLNRSDDTYLNTNELRKVDHEMELFNVANSTPSQLQRYTQLYKKDGTGNIVPAVANETGAFSILLPSQLPEFIQKAKSDLVVRENEDAMLVGIAAKMTQAGIYTQAEYDIIKNHHDIKYGITNSTNRDYRDFSVYDEEDANAENGTEYNRLMARMVETDRGPIVNTEVVKLAPYGPIRSTTENKRQRQPNGDMYVEQLANSGSTAVATQATPYVPITNPDGTLNIEGGTEIMKGVTNTLRSSGMKGGFQTMLNTGGEWVEGSLNDALAIDYEAAGGVQTGKSLYDWKEQLWKDQQIFFVGTTAPMTGNPIVSFGKYQIELTGESLSFYNKQMDKLQVGVASGMDVNQAIIEAKTNKGIGRTAFRKGIYINTPFGTDNTGQPLQTHANGESYNVIISPSSIGESGQEKQLSESDGYDLMKSINLIDEIAKFNLKTSVDAKPYQISENERYSTPEAAYKALVSKYLYN